MTSAIVVGSGPNGLAAAITLAQRGIDVTLIEAADTVGGGLATSENTLPGLLHDDCAAVVPTAVMSPFIRTLDLESYGLQWAWPEVDLAHPLDGGRAGVQEEGLIQQEGGRQASIGRAAIGTQDRQSDRISPSKKGDPAKRRSPS